MVIARRRVQQRASTGRRRLIPSVGVRCAITVNFCHSGTGLDMPRRDQRSYKLHFDFGATISAVDLLISSKAFSMQCP